MRKIALLISTLLFLYGCGSHYYGRGWEFLENNDYQNAKEYFFSQVNSDADNYYANFGLGIVFYNLKDPENSIKYLEKANSLEPKKSEIKYYLGLCYENQKKYDNALFCYGYYKDENIDSRYKSDMEKRYIGTLKLKYKEEAQSLILRENQIKGEQGENTLAILSFENNSGNPEYDPLKQGFPTMFITDFSLIPQLKIIERLRLQALLDEIVLNKQETFDQNTAQKAGRLLAAKQILRGSFKITKENNLTLDLAIIETQTGEVKYPVSQTEKLENFYRMEKDIVLSMVSNMGIMIPDNIRQKILIIPTESFFNFLERCKKNTEMEKIQLSNPMQTMESVSIIKTANQGILNRLNMLDNNTGTEGTEQRTDIPSRFLPDPPLPPE
jgi:tetratricopeptide (TPR) repeat protein